MERNNTFTTMLEELNYQELSEIKGGITPEQYCAILNEIIENNWGEMSPGAREGAIIGYQTHCVN